jgi:type II secretory pathway pseudopilin PulG
MKRVIYVIGLAAVVILASWLVRNWTTQQVKASTAKFNSDMENLFSGLQQYKENVGSFPVGKNAEVVKALLGQNPKKLIILVGRKNELNERGEFVDPWGTPLRIYFSDKGVLVRSAGPNRRFDDSTAVECDDYFRSNKD